MNQALYRKYRSKSFKDVVGQEHITKTLGQAIKTGRISHAYLFTGPRGVGKTSVARILAHEVNELPYKGEAFHLDIIEIDAASNRRIDEIRDLRDRVKIAPVAGKYKVYIIDEVHMLTREAFNALLKTLEEPPAHCIFILATTEAHKVPETIVSRTQRFEFKPISSVQGAKHLQNIANQEKIDVTPDALSLLAEFGNGSFRDSIGFLDQLSTMGKKITESDVREVLGLPSAAEITMLRQAVREAKPKAMLNILQALKDKSITPAAIASGLSAQLREEIINGSSSPAETKLLKQLIDVPSSNKPFDYIEIVLLETINESSQPQADIKPKTALLKTPKATRVVSAKNTDLDQTARDGSFDLNRWEEIVSASKSKAASIYTALRLTEPSLNEGLLELRFQFPLHQKKLEHSKNKAMLADIIQDITGSKIKIISVVDKQAFKRGVVPKNSVDEVTTNPIHSINNIFGTAEVLD
jgi:DNA polymerase-3 subunit gamma/tau